MSYVQLVLGIVAIIGQILPLLTGGNSQASETIRTIVEQLQKWLPIILDEVRVLYGPVKEIIGALSESPAALPDQLQKLSQMDSELDAAFEAAAKDVDPDAPAT